MKISTKGRYAVRAMIDLAYHSEKMPVTLSQISLRQKISSQYLEQLFVKLRREGLVESMRGPGGGYFLAKDPQEITIKDIFSAVEENINPVDCIKIKGKKRYPCNRLDSCVSRLIWNRLGNEINRVLESITLKGICEIYETKKAKNRILNHNYVLNI